MTLVGERLAKSLSAAHVVIYSSSVLQMWSSAVIVGKNLCTTPRKDERIRPMNIGVLAGLTRAEAVQQYPEPATRLELWRQEKLRVDELRIPGSEEFEDFLARARSFVAEILAMRGRQVVVVGSRSILIMIQNIVLGPVESFPEGYQLYEFNTGSVVHLSWSGPDTVAVLKESWEPPE